MYEYNDDGLVINSDKNFATLASDLFYGTPVVLNWTDGMGSVHNVLLSCSPNRIGAPGGIVDSGGPKLWVGVAGLSTYAFSVGNGYLAPDYVAEKLKVSGGTARELAKMLTAVRNRLSHLNSERFNAIGDAGSYDYS